MSNEGFQASVWGPMLWSFMHMVAMNFPLDPERADAERHGYVSFFASLGYVLPCGECRDNYKMHTTAGGACVLTHSTFRTRESLTAWVNALHNQVSEMKRKPRRAVGIVRSKRFFEQFRGKCEPRTSSVIAFIPKITSGDFVVIGDLNPL